MHLIHKMYAKYISSSLSEVPEYFPQNIFTYTINAHFIHNKNKQFEIDLINSFNIAWTEGFSYSKSHGFDNINIDFIKVIEIC